MSRVVEAIRGFCYRLTGPGVAAVSGGADSVALLRGLVEADVGPVTVAHYNHRLRPEADADEAFVRDLAAGLRLDFRIGSADVRVIAAEGNENLEATARRLRYDWLARTAVEVGAEWVATGHTADDQAETILHRLIRGSGLHGVRGIAAVRRDPSRVPVVRPLLTVTRADVLAYLADLGQPFRTDSTNTDPTFTRNRIRHELLPLLRSFNPEVVAALARLARQADEAVGFLDDEARRLFEAARRPPAGDIVVLAVEPFRTAHPVLIRAMFRLLWDLAALPARGMTAEHWDRLRRIAVGEEPAADFPGGVHVRRVGRVVQLSRRM